jgi:hypothetical protein
MSIAAPSAAGSAGARAATTPAERSVATDLAASVPTPAPHPYPQPRTLAPHSITPDPNPGH